VSGSGRTHRRVSPVRGVSPASRRRPANEPAYTLRCPLQDGYTSDPPFFFRPARRRLGASPDQMSPSDRMML
ncbi:unnamed protein product, partial [Acidocella sp. C78]